MYYKSYSITNYENGQEKIIYMNTSQKQSVLTALWISNSDDAVSQDVLVRKWLGDKVKTNFIPDLTVDPRSTITPKMSQGKFVIEPGEKLTVRTKKQGSISPEVKCDITVSIMNQEENDDVGFLEELLEIGG